jgi:sulfur carrier protein ThiS
MINAKVIRLPGTSQDVALNDGATVADALRAANTSVSSGEQLTVNGTPASTSTAVREGDRVVIVKGAKGNK